jgi:pyridoxamine 5'-phosphate oxidase
VNRDGILAFLNTNPGRHLATLEINQLRVRGMFMYRADTQGIIFHTGAFKSLYSQLRKNKKVEICFNRPDKQVRVARFAEILER